MYLSLKHKIVLITTATLFIGIGSTTVFNSIYFSREYSKAIHTRTIALGKLLKNQLDTVLGFDISIDDLVGFEDQCQNLVNNNKDIAYAMVLSTEGEVLFHNDTSQHGQVITDSAILQKLNSRKDSRLVCTIQGDEYRDFIIPVFGEHNEHIGAVRVGFPSNLIANKTKSMIFFSSSFATAFLVFCIVLLVVLLHFWISKPFRLLVSAIHSVRQKGTSSYKLLKLEDGDEIGKLASGFNQMVLEIRQYNQKIENHMKNLERKVKERTLDLEQTNAQLNLDILKRKKTEKELIQAYNDLKSTQAQLIQSSKLASIGELASGVAHELNQPLTVIRANAQFVMRNIDRELGIDMLTKQIKQIEKNTKRMMNIIDHLRSFSRHTETDFIPVDINQVINDCFMMIGEQLRLKNIESVVDLFPYLPMVQGNHNQLEQVFLNLLANAKDAILSQKTSTPKRIEIVTRVAGTGNGENAVEIMIKDTGSGIETEALEKIFDPFFTTKETGKGTGLGLSISYGIVKDHGGEIWLSETSKKGTTFQIHIPVTQTENKGAT